MIRTTIVFGLCLVAANVWAGPKKKVFVANLQARNLEQGVAEAIDIAICNSAHRHKSFDVTCPHEVKDVLAFDSMNAMLGGSANCEGGDCAGRIASRVKADLMITGSVAKLENGKFVLTLELVEPDTAKSRGRVEEQVTGKKDELFKRAEGAVKKLMAKAK